MTDLFLCMSFILTAVKQNDCFWNEVNLTVENRRLFSLTSNFKLCSIPGQCIFSFESCRFEDELKSIKRNPISNVQSVRNAFFLFDKVLDFNWKLFNYKTTFRNWNKMLMVVNSLQLFYWSPFERCIISIIIAWARMSLKSLKSIPVCWPNGWITHHPPTG